MINKTFKQWKKPVGNKRNVGNEYKMLKTDNKDWIGRVLRELCQFCQSHITGILPLICFDHTVQQNSTKQLLNFVAWFL